MMRRTYLAAALLLAALAAAPSARAQSDRSAASDSAAVVATVQALFDAMRTRDTAAIRRLFEPGSRLVATRAGGAGGGPAPMRVSSLADFLATVATAREELRERMWSPEVRVDGDIAALWAPYDFHRGERFSHCGVDAAHLVRAPDGWKIVSLVYTVRPAPCAPPR